MQNENKDDVVNMSNKKIIHLHKIARLQGFVSEAQIEEVAGDENELAQLKRVLIEEKIPICNVSKATYKSRTQKSAHEERKGNFSDPTWIYMNSLGRVPLMSRGQEVQHAILMRFAQYKLLDMAYRLPEVISALYVFADELSGNKVECVDILRIEEERIADKSEIEEQKQLFLSAVEKIKVEYEKLEELKKTCDSIQQIQGSQDYVVELCQQLKLNSRRIKDLLEKYKRIITSNSMCNEQSEFTNWEGMRNQAKCAIIEANVRLVVSIAKRYIHRGL
jgi:DNA-directed RNA polymerase sigma subunit (sigma70/sigma32)